jgi:hypothetical protein
MKVSVDCDTYTNPPSVFDNFPVIIETECGLKEIFPDSEKIILPQIHGNIYQPQKIGLVSVQAPPNITLNSTPSLMLGTSTMIILANLGASITYFSIFATVLAIFDPTHCMNITKNFVADLCNFFIVVSIAALVVVNVNLQIHHLKYKIKIVITDQNLPSLQRRPKSWQHKALFSTLRALPPQHV